MSAVCEQPSPLVGEHLVDLPLPGLQQGSRAGDASSNWKASELPAAHATQVFVAMLFGEGLHGRGGAKTNGHAVGALQGVDCRQGAVLLEESGTGGPAACIFGPTKNLGNLESDAMHRGGNCDLDAYNTARDDLSET